MFGIGRSGDVLPDFVAHLKVFRNLTEVADELPACRRPLESRIVTGDAKERLALVAVLAEFAQAFARKIVLAYWRL